MRSINKNIIHGGLAGATLLAAASAHSVTLGTFDNTTVKIGGYVKLDAMFSDFSEGPVILALAVISMCQAVHLLAVPPQAVKTPISICTPARRVSTSALTARSASTS